MNIVIPMAGEGRRFSEAGYKLSKPSIPTIDRRTGDLVPMVVGSVMDLPNVEKNGSNVVFIDRHFHKDDGTEESIKNYYPESRFITVNQLTEGQACTCLLSRDIIDNDEELLIAGCDNGIEYSLERFNQLKRENDLLVFTYRHNDSVLRNPDAYGWMIVNQSNHVIGVSIKKSISNTPMEDHAVVSAFWFRRGSDFVAACEKMIAEGDKVNGEYYVDQAVKHALDLGLRVSVFEVDRYLCWGTPSDYEDYQNTYLYWRRFLSDARCPI